MSTWNRYHLASSIEDALRALSAAEKPACLIGGGTDLLLEIQQGHHAPVNTLVDVSRIPEMLRLEEREDRLFIGAAVPVSEVAVHPLVRQHARAVSEACALIGGPQVRNSATLGGNVAHALPAADGMIGLLALDAQAEIASREGRRLVGMAQLFRGPGQSTLDPQGEILVGFSIQRQKDGEGSCFQRVMRPQGVALPILNLAAWVKREGNRLADIRVAVGPAGPTPQRARAVEDFLRGCEFNAANLEAAMEVWSTSMRFRTSPMRATSAYRSHVGSVLLESVLMTAWSRTEGKV